MSRHNRRAPERTRPIPRNIAARTNQKIAKIADAEKQALTDEQANWAIGRPIDNWNSLLRSLKCERTGIQIARIAQSGLVMIAPDDFSARFGKEPIRDVPTFTSGLGQLRIPGGNKPMLAYELSMQLDSIGIEEIADKIALVAEVSNVSKISSRHDNPIPYSLDSEAAVLGGYTGANSRPKFVLGALVLHDSITPSDALESLEMTSLTVARVGNLKLMRTLPEGQ